MMSNPIIVSAVRTPIGKFKGTLKDIPATRLGATVVRTAWERAGIDPATVDEVIMGNVVQAGEGQNPARQASVFGGVPPSVGAFTVNKVCGSGLKAVMLAAQAIKAGDGDTFIAGGMESMNQGPYILYNARFGYRLGDNKLVDTMVHDGLWCPFEDHHMGNSAEWIAREFNLTREDLDTFALESHRRAIAAIDAGKFEEEIVPVEVPAKKGTIIFDTDETPRRDTSMEALARLRPAFDPNGIVTAGNSPGITDGASALVVMSEKKAEQLGLQPLARITAYAQAAVKPLEIFTAPIFAMRNLMAKLGMKDINDFDLIEINEAFAAQMVADMRALGADWNKVNIHGGAIALGHPIGASGARVLTTLIYALKDQGLKTGAAGLCLGGGEAVALAIEMLV